MDDTNSKNRNRTTDPKHTNNVAELLIIYLDNRFSRVQVVKVYSYYNFFIYVKKVWFVRDLTLRILKMRCSKTTTLTDQGKSFFKVNFLILSFYQMLAGLSKMHNCAFKNTPKNG